jgi:hypothetical protein
MADYEKLNENRPFFTGAVTGQLYIRFLAYQGLGSGYTKDNKPAISITVEGEELLHPEWSFNPKRLNQVDEVLLYLNSRNSKVKIHYRDPVSHQEIGTSTVEPSRMPNVQLATLWFKIHDTAKVMVHAYWSALTPHDKFTSDIHDLSHTRFSVFTDRPFYLAGETVAGVVIYRPPNNLKPLSSVRLQVAGYSRQISDGDFPDESKHTFFTHEAILLGSTTNTDVLQVAAEYYIWTFNFPLPYNIPPSGAAAGNFYYLLAREIETGGSHGKTLKKHFGIRRVFFPRELMEPAVDPVPGEKPAVAVAPASAAVPSNDKKHGHHPVSSIVDEDEVDSIRRSVHVLKLMEDDESMEDSEENAKQPAKAEKSDKSENRGKRAPKHSEASEKDTGDLADATSSVSPREGGKKKKHGKKHKKPEDVELEDGGGSADEEEEDIPVAAEPNEKPLKTSKGKRHDPNTAATSGAAAAKPAVGVSSVHSIGGNGKSSVVLAATPPNAIAVRLPARVRPGLMIQMQPSSGLKHLSLPIELENTTNKPLASFYVSVNYIVERTFRTTSLLTGAYEYTAVSRFYVTKKKFKDEPGWPLAVGQKWSGVVRLALSESIPASVDAAHSPIFSRTYYAKVQAAAKGVFTKQKVSKKFLLLVGDYDWNTRPLPVQHAWNTPIRFTVFTLPCGPITPAFLAEDGSFGQAAPTLANLEQSEAVDLEASMML